MDELKKYVDVMVRGVPKKVGVAKIPKWVCHECGKETFQPEGKVIEVCECGEYHVFMVEPHGEVIEYQRAEGWFIKEVEDHTKEIMKLDTDFRQSAFRLVKLQQHVKEVADKLEYAEQVKMKNIIELGIHRHKLHKRQDMDWRYNPQAQRFVGVKKKAVVK